MPYYMLLTADGAELANGLAEHDYRRAAQNHANNTGATVYAVASGASEDDDGEPFEPASPRATVDPSTGAVYVYLPGHPSAPGCVARTVELAPGVLIDHDAAGRIIGVEVVNQHRRGEP